MYHHARRRMPSARTVIVSVLAVWLVSSPMQAQQERSSPSAGDAQNGTKLYGTLGCSRCHGDAGQGSNAGPRLDPNSMPLGAFVESVRAPAGTMPPFSAQAASDAQLTDIYAFLRTAPASARASIAAAAPAGNAENGKKLYNAIGCWSCHGYSAQGARTGARLAPNPIPFAAFARYVREPGGDMPPYTLKVLSDAQLADIYAFLRSIPPPRGEKDIPSLNQ